MYDNENFEAQSKRIMKLLAGITLVAVIFGLILLLQRATEPPPNPPPAQIEINITGRIVDDYGKPVLAQHVLVNVDMLDDKPASVYEHQTKVGGNSRFEGSLVMAGASTGCVSGYIEIDHYPEYDFEFGIDQVEYGTTIQFTFMVGDDIITYDTELAPSEIQPGGVSKPVVRHECET